MCDKFIKLPIAYLSWNNYSKMDLSPFTKTSLVNAVFILFSIFLYGTDRFSEPKVFWEFFAKSCIQCTGVQKKSKLVNENTHVFTPLHINAFKQDFVWWIYKKNDKITIYFIPKKPKSFPEKNNTELSIRLDLDLCLSEKI